MALEYDLIKNFKNLDELGEWVRQQFQRTEEEFNLGREAFYLKTLGKLPRKPREGMIVLLDVDVLDPINGSAAGFYGYRGGAWQLLG